MIEIDGSKGEGGGQIVRSSLALSAITGKPFTINNVRAGRKKPGLKRQHVTCVKAAAQICNASITGATLESSVLTFHPNELKSGEYHFRIGTAGSGPLVAQTVLPALMLATGNSTVIVEDCGTHNPMAPSFDYLEQAYLPQVQKMGPSFDTNLESFGFYPAGGGKFKINVQPVGQLSGFTLVTRGGQPKPIVSAIVSALPTHIGDREVNTIRRKMNWDPKCVQVIEAPNPRGPGNAVMIQLQSPNVSEIFMALGRQGVRAEQVAKNALKEAKQYLDAGDVPVGEHLADQLMLPLGLSASQGKYKSVSDSPANGTQPDS